MHDGAADINLCGDGRGDQRRTVPMQAFDGRFYFGDVTSVWQKTPTPARNLRRIAPLRRGFVHGTGRTDTTEGCSASNRPAFPTSGHRRLTAGKARSSAPASAASARDRSRSARVRSRSKRGSPVTKRLCWRVALEPDAKTDAVAAIYDLLDRERSPATAARVEQLIEALGRPASHEYATEPQERDLTG